MTNELQTVGAMHQCRAGEPYSTCVHCGALAEALNKPCPHFMRDAAQKLAAVASPTPQVDSFQITEADALRYAEMESGSGASDFAAGIPQADSAPHPIDPAIAADLERSDWTPEEALRWYAAGKHYDTVPNGDGSSSARILDNGAVASNALKSMSREYAEHKGDVALTAPQADSQPAPQGETNVQLDTDSNPPTPGQQRDVAGPVALGQPVGNGSDQAAGHTGAQGDKLLTVAERNIRSFLRSAVFKSESDREAALNCVDVLWEAARAPADSQPASVLQLAHSAFAEIAMAFPKAYALHKVGIADTAVREALAAPAAQADCQPAQVEVADAMADSQYLAGVSAGWNAANADDPNAALRKLHESRAGYLKPLSAARAPADSVPTCASNAAETLTIPEECPHIIWFDDHEMRPAIFAGTGARKSALATFKKISVQWNAHLFVRVEKNSRDDRYPCASAQVADSVLEDTARLDWLDQNIFYREMDEWDAKHGGRGDCTMWVIFAPKGHQGSARNIIDAARKQGGA